jgi:putative ABC transport system permease protein
MRGFMIRVPLAWCNLVHDPGRLVLSCGGVAFAVVLMFMQYGFRNALLDSNDLLIEHFNGDLVLLSGRSNNLATNESFSRRQLVRASGVPGVRSVVPLYIEGNLAVLRDTSPELQERRPSRQLRVIGVEIEEEPLLIPELDPAPGAAGSLAAALTEPGTALYDRQSMPSRTKPKASIFGPLAPGLETELAGRRLRLIGGFDLGIDFSYEGTLIVSRETFANLLRLPYYPGDPFDQVQIGLIRTEPGASVAEVQRRLRDTLAEGDVLIFTKEELLERERDFWRDETPIGFVFGLGVAIGFLVGTVICYQILSSGVADHLAEYATLRAIGYPGRYLSLVVLQEGLLLALGGFVPGLALSAAMYWYLHKQTGLPLRLTVWRVGYIFLLTVVMCSVSAWVALRKAREADPAEVF